MACCSDFCCVHSPKCEHCNARIDLGDNTCHSHFCPAHTRCEFCNIPETLPRTIHNFNCPKWNWPENQERIREIHNDIIQRRYNILSLLENTNSVELIVPNFDHLQTASQENCPICLKECSNLMTTCGHYFHKECLEKWCKISKTCPLCRRNDFYYNPIFKYITRYCLMKFLFAQCQSIKPSSHLFYNNNFEHNLYQF